MERIYDGTWHWSILCLPKGAKKLLSAIDKHGFDQSDFMINSKNVRMQYIVPSPVKFNTVNLSTSYGI